MSKLIGEPVTVHENKDTLPDAAAAKYRHRSSNVNYPDQEKRLHAIMQLFRTYSSSLTATLYETE